MMLCHLFDNRHSCITAQVNRKYCTISTVSSVTRHSWKKSPRFKLLEFKIKFIGHLGQQIFRIHELTVEMVQYLYTMHGSHGTATAFSRCPIICHIIDSMLIPTSAMLDFSCQCSIVRHNTQCNLL